MIYTNEQYEILSQAKPHFETVKRDYIRNAPKWLTEQIINVYEIATKKTILNKDMNCSICVMNIYKLIGKTYDADTKERKEKINETSKTVTEEKTNEAPKNVTKKSKKSK